MIAIGSSASQKRNGCKEGSMDSVQRAYATPEQTRVANVEATISDMLHGARK